MRAQLQPEILTTRDGADAEAILRSCVHCGFCNATCPTYQLLGDERDGPRGRIYQIKSLLEGAPVTAETLTHLDRCLGCRACETTCPSGVQYGRLLDYARPLLEAAVPRTFASRLSRWLLRRIVPSPVFPALLALGRLCRPLLPRVMQRLIPLERPAEAWPVATHSTRWLALDGCVQHCARPSINAAAARVLDRSGISLTRAAGTGCCGALAFHLGVPEEARTHARRNIDIWWPLLEAGAAGVFCASSGCTPMLKSYGDLLQDDPAYAEKAARIAQRVRDATELIEQVHVGPAPGIRHTPRVAVQAPCSLQHALRGAERMDALLVASGCVLVKPVGAQMCCGSAGAYSLLQPALSGALLRQKLDNLAALGPEIIATSNIGCMLQLEKESTFPVRHWLEIVDSRQSTTSGPRGR